MIFGKDYLDLGVCERESDCKIYKKELKFEPNLR